MCIKVFFANCCLKTETSKKKYLKKNPQNTKFHPKIHTVSCTVAVKDKVPLWQINQKTCC